jgi:hypothetical protein
MIPLDSPILNFFYFIKSGATVIVHGYPAWSRVCNQLTITGLYWMICADVVYSDICETEFIQRSIYL